MGQVLHGGATTTKAVRRTIQHSQESLRALARRHGINPKTVAKWRKRGSILAGGDVVAAEVEEVADLAVGGEEALRLPRRLEALHLPFSSARRLMGVPRAVVEPLVPAVLDRGHHLALRRAIAGELVGDHGARRPALALE